MIISDMALVIKHYVKFAFLFVHTGNGIFNHTYIVSYHFSVGQTLNLYHAEHGFLLCVRCYFVVSSILVFWGVCLKIKFAGSFSCMFLSISIYMSSISSY